MQNLLIADYWNRVLPELMVLPDLEADGGVDNYMIDADNGDDIPGLDDNAAPEQDNAIADNEQGVRFDAAGLHVLDNQLYYVPGLREKVRQVLGMRHNETVTAADLANALSINRQQGLRMTRARRAHANELRQMITTEGLGIASQLDGEADYPNHFLRRRPNQVRYAGYESKIYHQKIRCWENLCHHDEISDGPWLSYSPEASPNHSCVEDILVWLDYASSTGNSGDKVLSELILKVRHYRRAISTNILSEQYVIAILSEASQILWSTRRCALGFYSLSMPGVKEENKLRLCFPIGADNVHEARGIFANFQVLEEGLCGILIKETQPSWPSQTWSVIQ